MSYLALVVVSIIAVELFTRLPFMPQVTRLGQISRKSRWVIGSPRISDHWKEKALQRYSIDMMRCSLLLGVFLVIVFGALALVALGLDALLAPPVPTLEFAMTGQGLVLATVVAIVYYMVRKRLVSA